MIISNTVQVTEEKITLFTFGKLEFKRYENERKKGVLEHEIYDIAQLSDYILTGLW